MKAQTIVKDVLQGIGYGTVFIVLCSILDLAIGKI